MVSLRPATPADLGPLVTLDPIALHDPARRQALAEWIALGQCHAAIADHGAPVGYAALTRGFFRAPFIEMLQVAEAARRQGIGRLLLGHCIALTPPDLKLWTSTNQSNAPMRALLPMLGFMPAGMVEHLDPGDPELIYLRWPAGQGPA